MDALVPGITIGETSFFRHREHFDALRDVVLPDLADRNNPIRQLRIWCAGCADGAEPYSLSILLQREWAERLTGWNISILGTDIGKPCLQAAREARFEEWSLRATPESMRQACFEQDGKQWSLSPRYRAGVSFQLHNLVDDPYPPPGSFGAFDLIVCRNVMIYFAPDLMRQILERFHRCLTPGGWLLVGPSEPNMTHFGAFRAVNAPGVTLYQRPVLSAGDRAEAVVPFRSSYPPAAEKHPTPVVATGPTLADLRSWANQGDWEHAVSCGRQLVETDNLNPLAHFHYALVLEQTGNRAEAERSFRRAIYLNRRCAPAHYHLGVLLQSLGEVRQAARCFGNALSALESQPAEAVVAGLDGISVAELGKLAQTRIESMRAHT
jgi:chemotaxis protein methyltransferase CheR